MTEQETTELPAVAAILESIQSILSKDLDPNKAPVNFDTTLEVDCSSPTSRSRFILQVGFQAWFAYFLAKESRSPIVEHIDQLKEENLRYVAVEICRIQAHDSVNQLYRHLFLRSNRAPKRRRKLIWS